MPWSGAAYIQIFTQLNTVDKIPLDEESARRRELHLTTHDNHNTQTSMPPARFETAIPASDRPQTLALDRSATGIGTMSRHYEQFKHF